MTIGTPQDLTVRPRSGLTLCGMVASLDPDREGVQESVLAARGAGIRVAARRRFKGWGGLNPVDVGILWD